MRKAIVQIVSVLCLAVPGSAFAQVAVTPSAESQLPSPQLRAPSASSFWSPLTAVPRDFVNFFSLDTARILGVASAGVMVAHRWDDDGIAVALGHFQPVGNFKAGNVTGGVYAQVGGAFAVYSIGKATGSKTVAEVGGELFRAQLLTQAIVQTMKVAIQRPRPDGSNNFSMPSGHTAGAVATATVLQRHFGWKVGVPAYAASAYVAASRMSANKHHLTDVMVGAAVGLAAGRTVTIGRSNARFALGVAPTNGGAVITFTKQ